MVLLLHRALLHQGLGGPAANTASPRCPGVLLRVPAAQVGHFLSLLSLRSAVLDGTQGALTPWTCHQQSHLLDCTRPDEEHIMEWATQEAGLGTVPWAG